MNAYTPESTIGELVVAPIPTAYLPVLRRAARRATVRRLLATALSAAALQPGAAEELTVAAWRHPVASRTIV